MRPPVRSLLAILFAASAEAATFVFVTSDQGDPIGQGRHLRLEPPAYTLAATREAGPVVRVTVTLAGEFEPRWRLAFAPLRGAELVPGAYEDARRWSDQDPTRPGLEISSELRSCSRLRGRFEVREARFGPAGEVLAFAVDFEQHCESGQPALRGSVRLAAGDATCEGAVPGTPCDDADACTPAAACDGGTCVGMGDPECEPAPDDCHGPGVCDPTAGTCLPTSDKPDGAVCDDGDACTQFETCDDGLCRGTVTAFCSDDADPCTDDFCDPRRGCVHVPIAGTCGRPGTPSTLLFVRSDPDDSVGRGVSRAFTPASGSFGAFTDSDGVVRVNVYGLTTGESWFVTLGAPGGERLAPGTYENTRFFQTFPPDPRAPLLNVGGPGFCGDGSGRFVVHEATHRNGGELVSLAADFEQRCAGAAGRLVGAIRLRTGDASCQAAPDGTPCENHNACAQPATCRSGVCVGAETEACEPQNACRESAVCDPTSSACVDSAPGPDGVACSDPTTCSQGTCEAGTCAGPAPPCFDGDVCTDDVCDGAGGCDGRPIDGSCWSIVGRTTVIAQYQGHVCTCTLGRRPTALALGTGGTYRAPGGVVSCGATTVVVPEEVGTATPGRKGRLMLEPSNLEEILALAASCSGGGVNLSRYRVWVKASRDGQRLRGMTRVRARVPGSPVVVGIVTRLKGHRTNVGGSGAPSPTLPNLDRCEAQIEACFRAALQ